MSEELVLFGYENKDNGFFSALEIMEQMPDETALEKVYDGWNCYFDIAMHQRDFRHDTDPHMAAALAFIAWKKGLQ